MSSVVEIYNQALAHLGEKRVQAVDEKSKEADACTVAYRQTQRAVLRDPRIEWNFATVYAALTLEDDANSSTLAHRFTYVYTYPTNCLRFLRIDNQRTPGADPIDYEVTLAPSGDHKVILTHQADAIGKYIVDVQDPTLYDPLFVQALSWLLAANIAMPLTKSDKVQQAMFNGYEQVVMRAMEANANEQMIYRGEEIPSALRARE